MLVMMGWSAQCKHTLRTCHGGVHRADDVYRRPHTTQQNHKPVQRDENMRCAEGDQRRGRGCSAPGFYSEDDSCYNSW
jgi:hypothetical protein